MSSESAGQVAPVDGIIYAATSPKIDIVSIDSDDVTPSQQARTSYCSSDDSDQDRYNHSLSSPSTVSSTDDSSCLNYSSIDVHTGSAIVSIDRVSPCASNPLLPAISPGEEVSSQRDIDSPVVTTKACKLVEVLPAAPVSMSGEYYYLPDEQEGDDEQTFIMPDQIFEAPYTACSQVSVPSGYTMATQYVMQGATQQHASVGYQQFGPSPYSYAADASISSAMFPVPTAWSNLDSTLQQTPPMQFAAYGPTSLVGQESSYDLQYVDAGSNSQAVDSHQISSVPLASSTYLSPLPVIAGPSITRTQRAASIASSVSYSTDNSRSTSPNALEMARWGTRLPDGTWKCSYPKCASHSVFSRGCDLRKHYKRHNKTLFCRYKNCPQSTKGGFSSNKDRSRHEDSHKPNVYCEWDGCGKVFSRVDNMKDHVKRVHLKHAGGS